MDEEISFPALFGDTIRIRRVGAATQPTLDQRARAGVAAREIRLGVEWNFGPILQAVRELHVMLRGGDSFFSSGNIDPSREGREFFPHAVQLIERELEFGRLLVVGGAFPLLSALRDLELVVREPLQLSDLPAPSARAERPGTLTFFEVRFVDEIGQAIGGLDVELEAGRRVESLKTNPAGVATLEDVESMSASVGVSSIANLEKILDPRWERLRVGQPPRGQNTQSFALSGAPIAGVSLKPAVPNTVVITPPLAKLFAELWDKSGRVRHAKAPYTITGAANFSATTDDAGRLLHEAVPAGNYTLSLEVEGESFESPLVALAEARPAPQVRLLGAVPRVVLARIRRFVFETNKSFLMPEGVLALQGIRDVYRNEEPAKLLIVGHTDTTGEPSINDPLSLERAKSTAAYLADDVDAWLAMYETSVPQARRWSEHEDLIMIEAMPDFGSKSPAEDPVRWFQRTRSLEVDGELGPKTRRQLITEYMNVDGTSLKQPREFDIEITTHGCGENFPLAAAGDEVDAAPEDDKEDAADRRVELFFFDAEFGILPPPPGANSGPGSAQYPEWRKAVVATIDLEAPDRRQLVLEWPELLTPSLPPETVLRIEANRTFEVPWSQGLVQGDKRQFVIASFDAPRCTLTAVAGDTELRLWNDQPVDDPENPPLWEHLLEELLTRTEDEVTGPDAEALVDEHANAIPNLS